MTKSSRIPADVISQISRLTTRIALLEMLCAAMYQFAGEVGAPARMLDVLVAAQNGEHLSEEMIDLILTVRSSDCLRG